MSLPKPAEEVVEAEFIALFTGRLDTERMIAKKMVLVPVLMAAFGSVMGAQTVAPVPPTGVVTGTITFGDSQRPARFAKVTLTPVKSDSSAGLGALTKKKDDVSAKDMLGALMGGLTLLATQTDLQGHYELTGVTPGDYYVLANVPGYVTPGLNAAMSDLGGALTGAPVVHVEANGSARGDETVERGATLGGRVTYDDGAPVPGAAVQVESTKEAVKSDGSDVDFGRVMTAAMSGGLKIAMTDDRGEYRIAGLPAGEYRVKVDLMLTSGTSMHGGVINMNSMVAPSKMTVYAPASLHESDAKKIELKAGEERTDVDVAFNLTGLHSVKGHVASAVDHHLLNSGVVTLVDTTDKKVTHAGAVGADGSFTIAYVPSGSYSLKVSDAADTVAEPKKAATGILNFQQDRVVKSYDDASQDEIVAEQDVAGINVELKESAKVKQKPDLNGIFGGKAGSGVSP